jgi:signal transduction histidine kinase
MALALGHKGRNRRPLMLAFASIAALFGLTNVAALMQMRQVRAQTDRIVGNTLRSIELVSRMGRDLDRQRLLVDEHIFEHERVSMARVEAQLAERQRDFADAARAYEPLALLPAEATRWRHIDAGVTTLRAPLEAALVLSRENRDADARRAMYDLDSRFDAIDGDISALIQLDHESADQTLLRIASLQRSSLLVLVLLGLTGIAIATVMGSWASRQVVRRETESLRHAQALEERNKDLDAFAGRVAHDLRGPLTTINLAQARLERRAASHQEGQAGERLRRAVTRMEALIEDLLALSRIGAEERLGSCEVATVAEQMRDDLAARLESEGATLRLDVAAGQARGSEGLLRQALANLVENAVKYRRPEVSPEVEVVGRAAGADYRLSVSDNGLGMSPDEAARAFEPFYRAKRAPAAPGTGLGLSIVKRVIEASGGTIAVQSQLGRGTTFVVTLPLAT